MQLSVSYTDYAALFSFFFFRSYFPVKEFLSSLHKKLIKSLLTVWQKQYSKDDELSSTFSYDGKAPTSVEIEIITGQMFIQVQN